MSRIWINSELESRLLDEVQHRQRARRARAALVSMLTRLPGRLRR